MILPNGPIQGNIGQIEQLISNLVINAKEAMPSGGVITLKARNRHFSSNNSMNLPEGDYIHIICRDQGIGIPKSIQRHIFDPYFSTKGQSRGMGLASVYNIMQKHKGKIDVDSNTENFQTSSKKSGTTFNIYFPAVPEAQPLENTHLSNEIQKFDKNILVLEDDINVRKILVKHLEQLGCEVTEARTGEEAIILYSQGLQNKNPYAAVFLDLTIVGGKGGEATIKELMKIDPEIMAVVCSGYTDKPIMSEFKTYGFQAVLPKPYTLSELNQLMQKLFHES